MSNDTYTRYIEAISNIKNANDLVNSNFKSDNGYREVLEHVSNEIGLEYLEIIKDKFKEFYKNFKYKLIELCNKNDKIGDPVKYDFTNNDFINCSSTNLRYILHSLIIIDYIKECKLNNLDIIEIGGGYGGLCYFLYNIAELYNININSYSIFDLEKVNNLSSIYLNHQLNNKKINTYTLNDNYKDGLKENSFLISNYAYSEISQKYQDEYTDKIINPYISYGFLTWNTDYNRINNIIKNKQIMREKEYPLTYYLNLYVKIKPF